MHTYWLPFFRCPWIQNSTFLQNHSYTFGGEFQGRKGDQKVPLAWHWPGFECFRQICSQPSPHGGLHYTPLSTGKDCTRAWNRSDCLRVCVHWSAIYWHRDRGPEKLIDWKRTQTLTFLWDSCKILWCQKPHNPTVWYEEISLVLDLTSWAEHQHQQPVPVQYAGSTCQVPEQVSVSLLKILSTVTPQFNVDQDRITT